jgi:hypothetical protein
VGSYPLTVADAYEYFENYKRNPKYVQRLVGQTDPGPSGMAFVQQDDNRHQDAPEGIEKSSKEVSFAIRGDVVCHRCGQKDHKSPDCQSSNEKCETYKATQTGNSGMSSLITSTVNWGSLDDKDEGVNFVLLTKGAKKAVEHQSDGTCKAHKTMTISQSNTGLPLSWILLDNQSTCDIFSNPLLLENVRTVPGYMQLSTQAGSTTTNLVGELPGYGTVWFHPKGIANILALANVKKRHRITYDSNNGNEFLVHKDDGVVKVFKESGRGLYYLDTSPTAQHVALVTTVEKNESKFTNRDYVRAKLARKIQVLIGRPELTDFVSYLDESMIPNCPIDQNDVITAGKIFGRDVGSLKGKTTRQNTEHVRTQVIGIPVDIMERYRHITLCVDNMFVNKIGFLMSISRDIHFITSEMIPNRKEATLMKCLRRVHAAYLQRGFKITQVNADLEFDCCQGAIAADMHATLNIAGEDEHVPEIEWCIRTVKERTRCTYNATGFDRYPPKMIVDMVFLSVFWINAFPHKYGISKTISPRTIITGRHIDYKLHCRIECGQYVQTHEKHNNNMESRTVGALALRPTDNAQGGYYFYSLLTGMRLNRTHWTELPMPSSVEERLKTLARRANAHRGLLFTDSDGGDLDDLYPDDDDEQDSDHDPDEDDGASYQSSEDSDFEPSDDDDNDSDRDGDLNDDAIIAPNAQNEQPGNVDITVRPRVADSDPAGVDDVHPAGVDDDVNSAGVDDNLEEYVDGLEAELDAEIAKLDSDYDPEDNDNAADNGDDDLDSQFDDINNELTDETAREQATANTNDTPANEETVDDPVTADDQQSSLRTSRRRGGGKPNYSHLKGQDGDGSLPTAAQPQEFGANRISNNDAYLILESIVLTQYNLKQGRKKLGDKGKQAVLNELQQLYDRDVIEPIDPSDLTPEERKGALRYLMFLKEKRDGMIKGRGCADGRPQRDYMTKEDTSSPTVATEALLMTCLIDAIERRDVATLDIPGAFMQSEMEGQTDW